MKKAIYRYNEKEFFTKILNNDENLVQKIFNRDKFYNLKISIEERKQGGYILLIYNNSVKVNKSDLPNNIKGIVSGCFNNFIINSDIPNGVQMQECI
ncbi:hypothetical protein IRP63_13860 (plasmid) [Clostridium botulinum]|uniref:Uncharacterized protein n=1 Tax=Clostridium botulinum C/D str. DC5 TaxID=1443128 RepID=A0A0A0HWM2_CLOBO|nr:hypothetical protein [Clostridium botulinum]KGM93584.1 hypothetical protein Z955_14655 [Clostridium botulinum C/D str. DC5]KOC56915.1 hypothetical protein ADU89_01605 [Clostridium botulinum]KOC57390.1 hypothetical protein ADU90_06145 [Clostridium botulinum]MCD3232626.1 hypothetical protein [Clostridium botulinum D/C]MCD3238445.1 hypothetical protein [Clostridium botulinum D/C]